MTTRVLIADDEPAARRRLKRFLRQEPACEVVGECSDGASLLAAVPRCAPDQLFLDVRMPELDGLAALRSIPQESRPVVVFVTAHSEYALPAFEVQALDYLLKPFDQTRFRQAVAHAREQIALRNERRASRDDESADGAPAALPSRAQDPAAQLRVGSPAKPQAAAETLLIKTQGRILVLRAVEIDWIEAAGKYVRLHVGRTVYLLREPLHRLADRLDPERFLRIHRSTVVNLDRIREFQPAFHGDFMAVLGDGTELTLSRSFRNAVESRLGQAL